MESQPALNLIPTIQQAIGNLLTTHEPEFSVWVASLYGPRNDRSLLAGDSTDVLERRHERQVVRFRESAARGVVRVRAHHLLRDAASWHRGVLQQPDHGPGVLLSERPRSQSLRQH